MNGDYAVGPASAFLVNSPATVAQAIQTRLRLFAGEWFLDLNEGLNKSKILGVRTQGTRDQEVQQRILNTPGVKQITAYLSSVNPAARSFTVAATVMTIYGQVAVNVTENF